MVEYPHTLRIAYNVVRSHKGNARAFVAGKIAHAVQAKQDAEAIEWQQIGHFVERLLNVRPGAPRPPPPRRPPRYQRVRTPGPR